MRKDLNITESGVNTKVKELHLRKLIPDKLQNSMKEVRRVRGVRYMVSPVKKINKKERKNRILAEKPEESRK
jgi:hypothetical protein